MRRLATAITILIFAGSGAQAATQINLSTTSDSGAKNGALPVDNTLNSFRVSTTALSPAGTGVLDPFVRLQTDNANQNYEQAYNTGASTLSPAMDYDNQGGSHVHAFTLANVPKVTIDGITYYEYLLDSNEPNSATGKVSLDQVQIFLGDAPDLTHTNVTPATPQAGLASIVSFETTKTTEVFRLNNSDFTSSSSYEIIIDSGKNFSAGSGQADMFFYVQAAPFDAILSSTPNRQYVYFYSLFGVPPGTQTADSGFEEWSFRDAGPNPQAVPEPTTMALALSGLGTLGLVGLRRFRRRPVEA